MCCNRCIVLDDALCGATLYCVRWLMLRRIYRRCAGDVLRCKMPVQPALGYSVLMSDQPHRSKGCAARMREYPAPCRMISVQPTLHQAVSAERCTERCCDGQPKSCAGHHESCTIIAYFSGTCKPRRRDFHRFPWGNKGAMKAAPPEAAPLLGHLCFLSVIDGVAPYQNLISDETAWIKAVSLVFLRSIAWHRAAAPVVCGSN